MTTNLKDINFGINQFCGPAVLSALTGKSTDECAAVISSINGRQEIRAVEVKDLIKALEKLRFDVKNVQCSYSTLFGALSSLSSFNGMYVILIPRHVIAVEVNDGKIFLIDNQSKSAIDASHSARLMQKVDAIYRVVKKAEPKFVRSEIKVEKVYVNNRLEIIKYNYYEDEKDNTKILLGSASYTYKNELIEISNAINQFHEQLQ